MFSLINIFSFCAYPGVWIIIQNRPSCCNKLKLKCHDKGKGSDIISLITLLGFLLSRESTVRMQMEIISLKSVQMEGIGDDKSALEKNEA